MEILFRRCPFMSSRPRREPLEEIAAEHWRDFQIDVAFEQPA